METSGINARNGLQALAGGLVMAVCLLSAGCSTPSSSSAPRSNVSREHALSLAKMTANTVGGQVFTIAATGSMKPTLDESSVVTIETVPFQSLRKGDIVIYRNRAGSPVIHRLFEQHGSRWLVLGDNNGAVDRDAVSEQNFVGRVCAIFYTSAGEAGHTVEALAQR